MRLLFSTAASNLLYDSVLVQLSMLEIHNEAVYDLLPPAAVAAGSPGLTPPPKLELRSDSHSAVALGAIRRRDQWLHVASQDGLGWLTKKCDVVAAPACIVLFLLGPAAALGRVSPLHMKLQCLGLVAAFLLGV